MIRSMLVLPLVTWTPVLQWCDLNYSHFETNDKKIQLSTLESWCILRIFWVEDFNILYCQSFMVCCFFFFHPFPLPLHLAFLKIDILF